MCAENQYVRIITKVTQGEPTIPPSPSHNNGDWLDTDIYEGELYIDSDTGKIYTRLASGIVDIGVVSSANIYNTDGSLPTGSTRTFDLDTGELWIKNGQFIVGDTDLGIPIWKMLVDGNGAGSVEGGIYVSNGSYGIFAGGSSYGIRASAPLAAWLEGDLDIAGNMAMRESGIPVSNDASVIMDISATTKGSRPVPRMTEAERDAIASPADYLEITNTTRERKEIYRPFWGWHPVGEITPDWGYWWIDEATGASGEFVFSATNGGLLTTLIDSTLSPTRLAGLSTGVNTNGEYRHITNPYLLGSTGLKSWSTKVAFDTLSNITNRYVARSGYVNNSAGLSTSIGMYFLYDEGGVYGTATASANWLCVCFTSGSPTIVDSGIPVISSPANPLQKLQIFDSGTGNNVKFYIDNALVATITTQIPTSSQTLSAGNIITKQAGTTARIMYDDYVEAKEKFNTPR